MPDRLRALGRDLRLGSAPGHFWRLAASLAMLLGAFLSPAPSRADERQPYGVHEFAVAEGPSTQQNPAIGGSRVIWRRAGQERRIYGRNLASGHNFSFVAALKVLDCDLDGDLVVTVEQGGERKGIFGYRLGEGFARFAIAPLQGGHDLHRTHVRISGNRVVWAEGSDPARRMDIFAHDLSTGETIPVCTNRALQAWPAVSGNVVVWADRRNAGDHDRWDLYGYDLAAGREFRITSRPEALGPPAIAGQTVAWWAEHDGSRRVLAYDLASGKQRTLADLGRDPGQVGVDVGGDLVVWSARRAATGDHDVYGYDLARGRAFIVSRAIGDQLQPRIAGRTVVWTDTRHRTLERDDHNSDIYGATLRPGDAPVPPAVGAPGAIDTRIQIVWPHGGAPVTVAEKANVGAYLVRRGTLRPGPCQWHPTVYLWRAVNNDTARIVATGRRQDYGLLWEFNNVDVAAARDPHNRIYFFLSVAGTPARTNIWAHAADARTYFPRQDVPTGSSSLGATVDAKIEIVWPHDNAPVREARRANITAALFAPGTLRSAPTDSHLTVRLYRAVNNGLAEEVAEGHKRLVTRGGITYPVWDFNNVDVSAARDPANKCYFYLSVDGKQTYTNVWVHGVDARTYFPRWDRLDGGCS